MTTPIKSLIEWIDEINNSIFALQASEIEIKMLAQFKAKLVEKLPIEEVFAVKCYNAGCNYMEEIVDNRLGRDIGFSEFMENYK